jgi:heme oxygenase (biliverdin-producing, ferredoxin)
MNLDAVKAATWHLHVQAERSGVIADIIAGRASARGMALLLRGLLPVYQVLDASPFGHPALARAAAIEADLRVLAPGVEVPLLPQGAAYAERVGVAGEALIAHAYVRYLGDLNGGPVLQRCLTHNLDAPLPRLLFNDYPGTADRAAFTRDYRATLDRVVQAREWEPILRETLIAFEMTIALSEAARAAAS